MLDSGIIATWFVANSGDKSGSKSPAASGIVGPVGFVFQLDVAPRSASLKRTLNVTIGHITITPMAAMQNK